MYKRQDAALFWELRDRTTTNKPIGMVTVGFRTTEFTYFDKGMKFNDKKSKSLELGNKTALEMCIRDSDISNMFGDWIDFKLLV